MNIMELNKQQLIEVLTIACRQLNDTLELEYDDAWSVQDLVDEWHSDNNNKPTTQGE
tara:strand:- start:914 stop:1084 length:171 start_codon:yes stop_codon:yes gene_type:complete